jgi:ATP-dependent RNA helicase DDX5/DBP2
VCRLSRKPCSLEIFCSPAIARDYRRYYWNRATNETTYERPEPAGNDEGEAEVPDLMRPPQFTSGSESAKEYRTRHEMLVQGQDIPDPIRNFQDTGFPSDVLKRIERAGFSEPTPIQAQCWPVAQSGRDLVGIAKTGSGKTLGYMLPGMERVRNARTNIRGGPQALVLAPTRELANQIKDEVDKYMTSGLSVACLYGGAARGPQKRAIEMGVNIVIATPGRLNDFLEYGEIKLSQVEYLVLDEADRMLDMGFEPQIQSIVAFVPKERQTLFFSATWPRDVKKIAVQFVQTSPVHVFIGSTDTLVANKDITQRIEVINGGFGKDNKLFDFLRSMGSKAKILIFCSTKRMCDDLSNTLNRSFGAVAIHGDKSQDARDYTLKQFKQGRASVMCATDVAARGLDIPDVDAVINYDFPNNLEDYVHRIGRTARAGAKGMAYSFFNSSGAEAKHAKGLCKVIRDANQEPSQELQQVAKTAPPGGGGAGRGRGGSGAGGMRFQASGGPPKSNQMPAMGPPRNAFAPAQGPAMPAPASAPGAGAAAPDRRDREDREKGRSGSRDKDKDKDRDSREHRSSRRRSRSRSRDRGRDRDRDREHRHRSRGEDRDGNERRERFAYAFFSRRLRPDSLCLQPSLPNLCSTILLCGNFAYPYTIFLALSLRSLFFLGSLCWFVLTIPALTCCDCLWACRKARDATSGSGAVFCS